MSESDKPLHVRVAEALGCETHYLTVLADFNRPEGWYCACARQCPRQWVPPVGSVAGGAIPRYDTSWADCGPLIEKYCGELFQPNPPAWRAWNRGHHINGDGPTPLIAVCNLLLALHASGKLKAA